MSESEAYAAAGLFLLGGAIFVLGGALTSRLLAPNRPNAEKNTPYECGEEPSGPAWGRFNPRFYAMGLIFLVFDVEVLLLFPWAVVFADPELERALPGWSLFTAAEAGVFIAVLLLGLAYIWQRGDIDWIRPAVPDLDRPNTVPDSAYGELNAKYAGSFAPDSANKAESGA